MPGMDLSTSPLRDPSDPLELRHAATDRATIVMVPERRLLAIDGVGSPASGAFHLASATLRQVGGELRTRLHQARGLDTRVGILECAWWIHPEVAPDALAHGLVFTLEVGPAGKRRINIPKPVQKELSHAAQWLTPLSAEEIEAARIRTTT